MSPSQFPAAFQCSAIELLVELWNKKRKINGIHEEILAIFSPLAAATRETGGGGLVISISITDDGAHTVCEDPPFQHKVFKPQLQQ
jgi:hypothetical protein